MKDNNKCKDCIINSLNCQGDLNKCLYNYFNCPINRNDKCLRDRFEHCDTFCNNPLNPF